MVPLLSISMFFGFHAQPVQSVATSTDSGVHSHPIIPPNQATSTPATGPLELDSATPGSAAVGDTVTLRGSGFTASNTVLLGGNVIAKDEHLSSFSNGHQEITFVLPSSAGPDCKAGEMCPMYMLMVSPGTYRISVENENGKSNSISFVVTGAPLTPEAQ